ncbi:hypothetical protein KUTeg_015233 [Tegillarca granosa]|uniref:Secreted protein n=1 Tax=Tegillarca granosa TaxID=220873 RepID=A0ABQ9EPK3_TEGGR|nr:hypothetical protein KUTeg_015233 [Tegillarca granosa]
MIFRLVVFACLIAFCSGRGYGRRARQEEGITCAGESVRHFGGGHNTTMLVGVTWYNKYNKDNLGPSGRPLNVQITFTTRPGSNKAEEIVRGNNPNDGSCLVWKYRDFQIYKGVPCYAEKGTDPETCTDQEWVHYKFQAPGSENKMLFMFYCADADSDPKTNCGKYFARCLSDNPNINNADRAMCRQKFADFNIGELPAEDVGSGYNACNPYYGNGKYS